MKVPNTSGFTVHQAIAGYAHLADDIRGNHRHIRLHMLIHIQIARLDRVLLIRAQRLTLHQRIRDLFIVIARPAVRRQQPAHIRIGTNGI